MNNGKICVSICAATADKVLAAVKSTSDSADLLEIRFDCLDPLELPQVAAQAPEISPYPLLATFRSQDQGGKRRISHEERTEFWFGRRPGQFWGGDFEQDIIADALTDTWVNRISSHHDFSSETPDVLGIYTRLLATPGTHIKIAIQAGSITDAIPLWRLLETATAETKPLIPVAMGEAGKWTRILGLAHGAFMTFASPGIGSETAPGQISAADMTEVFRVKELDKQTEVFGVVAGDSSYSVSPWMHNAAFKAAGMNRVFIPLQVADLDNFIGRMVKADTREIDLNFRGFSVTNPHKQTIIKHLDAIDETARKIGAVNTVKIEDGGFLGFNTDAEGFVGPLKDKVGDLKGAKVSIVGAGGASRACIWALQQADAAVTLFARDATKRNVLGDEFQIPVRTLSSEHTFEDTDILINTTPLGTLGDNEDLSIATAERLGGVKLVYDLVYNPVETLLIRNAKAAGVQTISGLEMLIAQGKLQFEIWTGEKAPAKEMKAAVRKKLGV